MCLLIVAEGDELLLDLVIIQKREFVLPNCNALTGTGVLIQLVVIAEIALIEYLVNGFATLTAKGFAGELNLFGDAFITTVIAFYSCMRRQVHNRLQNKPGAVAAF
jgi:hypothetical protein